MDLLSLSLSLCLFCFCSRRVVLPLLKERRKGRVDTYTRSFRMNARFVKQRADEEREERRLEPCIPRHDYPRMDQKR